MFLAIYHHPKSNLLVIPAHAQAEAGFYLERGPTEIVAFSDEELVMRAAEHIWNCGMPTVPTPGRDDHPRKPPYKLPGVRTWSDLERQCSLWHIGERPDLTFEIQPYISPPREHGFVSDPLRFEAMPIGSTLRDSLKRLLAIIRDTPAD